jgi:hypothetical protein
MARTRGHNKWAGAGSILSGAPAARGKSGQTDRARMLATHHQVKLFYDPDRKVGRRHEESGGSRGNRVDGHAGGTRDDTI